MKRRLSSRTRLMAALECRETDYVPCCFSAFQVLRNRCVDQREFIERQLAMGLDAFAAVATPPARHDPRVRVREWREEAPGEPYPLLHKEYQTPAGTLSTTVSQTEDWPWGEHVPFMDDFLIPRSRKPLITPGDNLDALAYLLAPPSAEVSARVQEECDRARALASEFELLTVCFYGMVGDAACWLAGIEPLILMAQDHPDFTHRLLALIECWNRQQMDVVLAQGVDLLVRRSWYENADIWSPPRFREFILPGLCEDARRAHQAGAKFGVLMSCASLPLVDLMIEAGVDVLLGVDPAQDRTMDLRALKQKADGRLCLWGGVCGYLTMECGTPDGIREQVRRSISVLAPGGGFILSPVTNIREDNERVWRNVDAMLEAWRAHRAAPA